MGGTRRRKTCGGGSEAEVGVGRGIAGGGKCAAGILWGGLGSEGVEVDP